MMKFQIRNPMTRCALTGAVALLAALPIAAQAQDDRLLSFVACPVLQDTASVPCWLAEHEGETYFLGIQTDASGWTPPLQGHQLLVEGKVTDLPRICGGIPLEYSGTGIYDKPVSGTVNGIDLPNPPVTSVMRELDNACRTVLPENPKFNNIESRRGPGPNVPPRPRGAPGQRPAPEVPQPPYEAREFELIYDFDSELAIFTINQLVQAVRYAETIKASAIEIVGYRASALLSSGEQLEEIASRSSRRHAPRRTLGRRGAERYRQGRLEAASRSSTRRSVKVIPSCRIVRPAWFSR
jgi:hypothetical protein